VRERENILVDVKTTAKDNNKRALNLLLRIEGDIFEKIF